MSQNLKHRHNNTLPDEAKLDASNGEPQFTKLWERYLTNIPTSESLSSVDPAFPGENLINRTISISQYEKTNLDSALNIPEFVPTPSKYEITFYALQEWEGYVTAIDQSTFTASLIDLNADHAIEGEEAEFLKSDIESDDLRLLRLGAIFRWSIGYLRTRGSKRRVSQIVFRRLPIWTNKEILEAKDSASKLGSQLKWESLPNPMK